MLAQGGRGLGVQAGSRSKFTVETLADDIHATVLPGLWAFQGHYTQHNFGHVLGDEVWSAWQLLTAWNMEGDAARLHVISDLTSRSRALDQFAALTPHLSLASELVEAYGKTTSGVVCFESLLIGAGDTGYWSGNADDTTRCDRISEYTGPHCPGRGLQFRAPYLPPFADSMGRFRSHAMRQLHVKETRNRHTPSILFLKKDVASAGHKFIIKNVDELVNATRHRFPEAIVRTVNWKGMPIREQVQLMANTDIVVSVPGSDLMPCVRSYSRC